VPEIGRGTHDDEQSVEAINASYGSTSTDTRASCIDSVVGGLARSLRREHISGARYTAGTISIVSPPAIAYGRSSQR
jgi:hypothetical protein